MPIDETVGQGLGNESRKRTSFQHWFMFNHRIYYNLLPAKGYAATGIWYGQLNRRIIFFKLVQTVYLRPCILTWFFNQHKISNIMSGQSIYFWNFAWSAFFIHNGGFLTTNGKANVDFFSLLERKLSESEVIKSRRRWSYGT